MSKPWLITLAVIALAAVAGLAGGKWDDFNYGPGDWLAEHTGLKVDSPYSYEKLWDPEIRIHVVDDLGEVCGGRALGCAAASPTVCDVYIGERSSPNTLSHELRHCHGWSHAVAESEYVPGTQWYPTSLGD